jgi:hypothetical protein
MVTTGYYTKHTWVEYAGTGVQKAGWLNNAETQYDEVAYQYNTIITHSASYYTKATCDSKYWTSSTDGTGSGFVCETLDGYTIAQLSAQMVPTGTIMIWSGAIVDIPSGWAICNGTSSPDLRDKFPIVAGNLYGQGTTGGAATVQSTAASVTIGTHALTLSELASHTHTYTDYTPRFVSNLPSYQGSSVSQNINADHSHTSTSTNAYTTSPTAHGHSGSTMSGDTTTGNNLPPYKAYAYIIKT